MKYSEFRKWLKRVTLNGRSTIFPDHGAKEIGKGLVEAIKKQLGIR